VLAIWRRAFGVWFFGFGVPEHQTQKGAACCEWFSTSSKGPRVEAPQVKASATGRVAAMGAMGAWRGAVVLGRGRPRGCRGALTRKTGFCGQSGGLSRGKDDLGGGRRSLPLALPKIGARRYEVASGRWLLFAAQCGGQGAVDLFEALFMCRCF